jgi:hypothetical protein
MSGWLIHNGHQVTLLGDSDANWTNLIHKKVRCIALGERYQQLYYYSHAKRLWQSLQIPKPDVIKSFDIGSSWIACQLAAITANNCKVIAGMYNPLVFKWYFAPDSLRPWEAKSIYLKNYLNNFPENTRLFCGIDQVEELEDVHNLTGTLWPIPIDTTQFEPALRKPEWGKIVSIGRLSPMKEYNLYMIDVVRDLRARGYNVSWSVYGEGEYKAEMLEQIKKNDLEDVIFLKGTVPYAQFRKVLEDAYVFVGMGTSVLEAALFQVPNVNAIAYDRKGMTTGPVYKFPRGSIGPGTKTPANLKVVDEIERILRLSPAEYQSEEKRVGSHVEVHEMECSMNHFLRLVRDADPVKIHKSLYLKNYPLWFLRRVMKGLVRTKEIGHPTSTPAVTTADVGRQG